MRDQDIIMVSSEELQKLHIIYEFLEKKISQKEAASMLNLSTRWQVKRIAATVKIEGKKAAVHDLREKPSNNKKPGSLKKKTISLYRQKYSDFGSTLATEKLKEKNSIKIGKETLRAWLMETGLHKKRRKPRPHRLYRTRKANFGEDGSGRRIRTWMVWRKSS